MFKVQLCFQNFGIFVLPSYVMAEFSWINQFFYIYFFGGLECVGHSFAYVDHLVFFIDVWIWTQKASRRAANLATHLQILISLIWTCHQICYTVQFYVPVVQFYAPEISQILLLFRVLF